jgi:phosphopantetheine adenylyltransferase
MDPSIAEDRLSLLPRDIWEICVPHLESPDLLCLYATGSSHLQASLRKTVRKMDVGIVSRRSLALWPNLKEISAGVVGRPVMRMSLAPFGNLTKLKIGNELESIDIELVDLKSLTYLEATISDLDRYLENCEAPLKTLIASGSGLARASSLSFLPPTITHLEIPPTAPERPLQQPLHTGIETLKISGAFCNTALPNLGLPPRLLHLYFNYNALDSSFIAQLPRTLLSLLGNPFSAMHPGSLASIPPSLTQFHSSTSVLIDQDLKNLPRTLELLTLNLNFRLTPNGLTNLPRGLTHLNLNQTLTIDDQSLALLPDTLIELSIPNDNLTGKAIASLPPRLESLSISFISSPEPSRDHPWVPFVLDPEYMSQIPFSLERIRAFSVEQHNSLPFQMLERFPPTLRQFTCSGWQDCIYTVLLDLREATSIEEVEEIAKAYYADTHSVSRFKRIIVYVVYPRTIEFSEDILTRLHTGESFNEMEPLNCLTKHKCHDILAFMKRVQLVYNTVTSIASEYSFADQMSHIILLPSADVSHLPSVQMIVAPTENARLKAIYRGALYSTIDTARHVRSKFAERISLSTFHLVNDVAVGGTFDHMHTGHRMLLGTCLLTAKKRLTIGITGAPLLVKKAHKEYLQSFEHRKKNVEVFCKLQRPDLFLDPVELNEPAGPTATDPNFDIIVVSEETAAGVPAINDIRKKNGLKPMEGLVIHLAESYGSMKDISSETKISSTTLRLRERLLDERLYKENPLATLPARLNTSASSSST